MADRESRDANDPRDLLRAMNKEARAEFEGEEAGDTGGRSHLEPERDGPPAGREGGEVGPSGGAPDEHERQRRGSTPDERTMERILGGEDAEPGGAGRS
jgi:hypothetical protein